VFCLSGIPCNHYYGVLYSLRHNFERGAPGFFNYTPSNQTGDVKTWKKYFGNNLLEYMNTTAEEKMSEMSSSISHVRENVAGQLLGVCIKVG